MSYEIPDDYFERQYDAVNEHQKKLLEQYQQESSSSSAEEEMEEFNDKDFFTDRSTLDSEELPDAPTLDVDDKQNH